MNAPHRLYAAVAATLLVSACGGDPATYRIDPPPAAEPTVTALSETVELPLGNFDCPAGGTLSRSGEDLDGDGVLSPDEVKTRETACLETMDDEWGAHEHELSYAGDRLVHHLVRHRETGHVLLRAHPYGQAAVHRADRKQRFTRRQLDAHLGSTGAAEAASAGAPPERGIYGRSSVSAANATSGGLGSTSADTLGLLESGNSELSNPCATSPEAQAAVAAAGLHCGPPVGFNDHAGWVGGASGCFLLTARSLGDTILVESFGSAVGEQSTSESTKVSASASASYGMYSGSAKATYTSDYEHNSFGGVLSFDFGVLTTLEINLPDQKTDLSDVTTKPPYVSQVDSLTYAQLQLQCGDRIATSVPAGLLISGELTFSGDSEAASSSFKSKVKGSSGTADVAASLSQSKSSSSQSLATTFTINMVGGGAEYVSQFTNALNDENIWDYYGDCFASTSGDAKTVKDACSSYLAGFAKAANATVSAFSAAGLPTDLSTFAIFPDGVSLGDDGYGPAEQFQSVSDWLKDAKIGTSLADLDAREQVLLDQFALLNEAATLYNRALYLGGVSAEHGADGLLALNNLWPLSAAGLESTFDRLIDGYFSLRTVLFEAAAECYGPTAVSKDDLNCDAVDYLRGAWAGPGTGACADKLPASVRAYATLADLIDGELAGDDPLKSVYGWYNCVVGANREVPSSTDLALLRHNVTALQLTASEEACFAGATPGLKGTSCQPRELVVNGDGETADVTRFGQFSLDAVWVDDWGTMDVTERGEAGGLVLFASQPYGYPLKDVSAAPRLYLLPALDIDVLEADSWTAIDEQTDFLAYGANGLLPDAPDGEGDPAPELVGVNRDSASLFVAYPQDNDDWMDRALVFARKRVLQPRYIDDGGAEKTVLPPTSACDVSLGVFGCSEPAVPWVVNGVGADQNNNDDMKCLYARYVSPTAFERVDPDTGERSVRFPSADVADGSCPADPVSLEKWLDLGASTAEPGDLADQPLATGVGFRSSSKDNGKIRDATLYYRLINGSDAANYVSGNTLVLGSEQKAEVGSDGPEKVRPADGGRSENPDAVLVGLGAQIKNNELHRLNVWVGELTNIDGTPSAVITLQRRSLY